MSFHGREQMLQRQKSERYQYCEKKERDTSLCPLSITNDRRSLFVEFKPDVGHGGFASAAKLDGEMQEGKELRCFSSALTKIRLVFVDKAGTTTTSTTSTLLCPFTSVSVASLIPSFSSDSEQYSLLSSCSNDSNDENEVTETDLAHSQIQFDAKKHNKMIPEEMCKCEESYNDCTNDSARRGHFQKLSEYGATIIKLKREIELIQHIQKNLKVINFEVDRRIKQKQKRMTGKLRLADREKNMQRLYDKSRTDYRMEGKKLREDIARVSELRLEERKNDFHTR